MGQGAEDDRTVDIFRVRDGRARGVPAWKLRTPHLEIPTQSVRSTSPLDGWREHAPAYALVLPDDAVFSHATAALALGLPLPRRVEKDLTLHVMRTTGRPPLVRRGLRAHCGLEHRAIVTQAGLRATSVADTWCDLAAPWLGLTVDELIIAGDAACELLAPTRWDNEEVHAAHRPGERGWHGDPALRGTVDLWQALQRRRRHKGKGRLLQALPEIRPRVWSPMETRSRLVVTRSGLPEPRLNTWVRGHDGEPILRGDLVWEEERTVGEYQGAPHDGLEARGADAAKRGLAEAAHWRVVEIFKADIFEDWRRTELIRRLAIHLGVPLEQVTAFVRR